MKHKFSKILGVGLAVVLVLTLGLVTAVPVAAANPMVQVTNVADGVDDAQSLALTAAAPPGGTVAVTPQIADSIGTVIKPDSIVSTITLLGFGDATSPSNGVFETGQLIVITIDFDGDGLADNTLNISAIDDDTAVISVNDVYTDTPLDDGKVTATDDESITGWNGDTATKDIQIGKHTFTVAIFDDGVGGQDEAELTAKSYYEGTFLVDGAGDGAIDDTVYFALIDIDSDGVYENMELSIADETYGEGGALNDGTVAVGNDEKLTASGDVVLGNSKFTVAYDGGTDGADDVSITALAYIKTGGVTVDSFVWYVAALDQNSDGVYDVLELSIGDDTFGEVGEGTTLSDGVVSDGDDEIVTAGTVVTMSGSDDDTEFYVDIVSDPATDPASFELPFEFDFLERTVTAYLTAVPEVRFDFNNDGNFTDPSEDVLYVETEYLTDTKGLAGTPVSFLEDDYYLLEVTTNSLQIMPVPRAGYTYDVKVLYPDGGGSQVYMEDVGVEAIQPVDIADVLNTWDGDSTTFITLAGEGVGTFSSIYFSAATNLDWADDLIEIDTVANGSGTTVGIYEIQPSDYADVEVELSISEFTYGTQSTFTVTVTDGGEALGGAKVQVWQDEDGDGNLETGTQTPITTGHTLSDGTKEFTLTPTAAGMMVMQVTMDIGGKEEIGIPDGINDVENTRGQATINPITLTIETSDMLFKDWTCQPTYTIKLADDSLFTLGATVVSLKGTPLDETEENAYGTLWDHDAYVNYVTDGDAHDVDGDADGDVQSTATFTPVSTGDILVKAEYDLATGVPEYLGTLTHEVTVAAGLNVSVIPTTYDAGNAANLVVTILGSDNLGPDGPASIPPDDPAADHNLNWAKVVVSIPVGQSLATGEYYFDVSAQNKGEANTGDATTVTFAQLLPNDASSDITVTVTGELDNGTAVVPVTKTIEVSGYVVSNIVPDIDQTVGDISPISMTVTTKEGDSVNNAVVVITADRPGGFKKDVNPLVEGKESFKVIVISGPTGVITYGGVNDEAFLVNDGYYEVTGIEFAEVGDVEVKVEVESTIKALENRAFTVLGDEVYTLSEFDPEKLTAGVEAASLKVKVTLTETGAAVTDVATITIPDMISSPFNVSTQHPADGVYTIIDPDLVSEAKTLTVTAQNADGTEYGTADLTVGLPAVSYVITDASEAERTLMLTGQAYAVAVTVTDALGEALADGEIEIGKYAEEEFTALTGGEIDTNPITLNSEGKGTFEEVKLTEEATLVWKVGKPVASALVLEPATAITVAEFSYDINPKEALVGEATTYTVTDNYGEPAADRDIKIVTPAIETVTRTTGPAGTPLAGKFMYTAPEAGDYYVSIKIEAETWQDPITVTVVSEGVPLTIQLYEGANPILYTGATMDLPDALTDIEAITEIIWQRDVSTGGEWWYYLVVLDYGQTLQLENDTVYIIVVSEDCIWELSQ